MSTLAIVCCRSCGGSGKVIDRWFTNGQFLQPVDSNQTPEEYDRSMLNAATKICKTCDGSGKVTALVVVEWQGMGSAPMDGTWINLLFAGWSNPYWVAAWLPHRDSSYPFAWKDPTGCVLVREWKDDEQPTGWKPIEPPSATELARMEGEGSKPRFGWIEYGKTFGEFMSDGLAEAGTAVYVGDEKILIGDVNENGGLCDCCPSVKRDAIVSHYWPDARASELK